jgi:hypothetical protein
MPRKAMGAIEHACHLDCRHDHATLAITKSDTIRVAFDDATHGFARCASKERG